MTALSRGWKPMIGRFRYIYESQEGTSDFWLLTSDFGLPTFSFGVLISDCIINITVSGVTQVVAVTLGLAAYITTLPVAAVPSC